MKENWVIPYDHAKSVSIVTKKSVYPVNLILYDHDFIEEMEIPNASHINVKIKGKWTKVYLD